MYRKLTLISLIFLFGSKNLSQIGLTVLTVSVFGVIYTLFRPIKNKFEDRLQTFVLWISFFDDCLRVNASVLLLAIGKSTCCSVFGIKCAFYPFAK